MEDLTLGILFARPRSLFLGNSFASQTKAILPLLEMPLMKKGDHYFGWNSFVSSYIVYVVQ